MKLIGYLLAACILLAILRVALAAIVAIYLVTLIICATTRPKETFGFLTYLLVMFLLDNHFVETMATIVAFFVVSAVARWRRSRTATH